MRSVHSVYVIILSCLSCFRRPSGSKAVVYSLVLPQQCQKAAKSAAAKRSTQRSKDRLGPAF